MASRGREAFDGTELPADEDKNRPAFFVTPQKKKCRTGLKRENRWQKDLATPENDASLENTQVKHFTLKLTAAATLAAAFSSAATAGGFMLTEQSVAGLGRSYAGAGIVGDDLSAVWYNPAGMALLTGTAFQMGAVVADLDLPVTTERGQKENGRKHGVPVPSMYLVHQIKDDMWFGFGVTVPYGMATEYNKNWELGDKGCNAEVKTFDFNPSVAMKLTDTLSFGAGVSLQYVTAQFESTKTTAAGKMRVRLNADGWAWGGNLGFMWQPTETVRVGLAYRSQVNHKADGYLQSDLEDGNGNVLARYRSDDGHAEMSGPHTVTLTGTWKATEALRLSGLVRWANWGSFQNLPISGSSLKQATAAAYYSGARSQGYSEAKAAAYANANSSSKTAPEYKWKDSWLFTVGADYTINEAVTVRGGLGYEISPVDDDKYRSATIPDADRVWFSLGATWRVNKQLQGDFGLAYLKGVGNKNLYDENTGKKLGKFDRLDAILWGAQFVYKFD